MARRNWFRVGVGFLAGLSVLQSGAIRGWYWSDQLTDPGPWCDGDSWKVSENPEDPPSYYVFPFTLDDDVTLVSDTPPVHIQHCTIGTASPNIATLRVLSTFAFIAPPIGEGNLNQLYCDRLEVDGLSGGIVSLVVKAGLVETVGGE